MKLDTLRKFKPLAGRAAFVLLVWHGFAMGVDGAQSLARFVVWVAALPLGVLAHVPAIVAESDRHGGPWASPALAAANRALEWAALALLVWFGAPITATAWALFMALTHVARQAARRRAAGAT